MNILVLTHSYPDYNQKWRGIFVQEQVRALSKNHDISVVYFKVDYSHFAPFSDYTFLKKESGRVIEYAVTINKSFPVITQIKYLSDTYRFIKNEILSKKKIDIIHSHLSYPGGFLGTIIQEKRKIPNILTEHSRIKSYFRSWIHKQCVKYTLRKTTCIISVSKLLREEIVSLCHRQVVVIHNIVDVDKFEIIRQKHDASLNIGFLGSLKNNNKGLDLLLKSASLLERKDFFLHIGGNGILLDSYKKMAKEFGIETKCKFYGEIERNEIADFYSKLDLFVLPSRYETFGIVLIEAMASGVPVISTKCGGPQEIVTPSNGILIQKENIEELKSAIISMSENSGFYNKKAIRNYTKENFGQEAFVKQISNLYQEILTKKSNE
jgi:glycosyltransferase involved in cell wall biosynthesis